MKNSKIRSIFILLMVIFGFGVQNALACRCVLVDESINSFAERAFGRSSAVFVAKVVGFEFRKGIPGSEFMSRDPLLADPNKFQTKVVKLEFERIWKGRVSKLVFATDELKTDSGMTFSSSCDFNFEAGARYIIFADESKGVLRTNVCSGTRKLTGSDDEKAILDYIGSLCLPDDPDEPRLQSLLINY